MCDYPNCKEQDVVTHMIGTKTLNLCKIHEELYNFISKVVNFDIDWGL